MIYEPNNTIGTLRLATAMMLASAAHFRKIGKYDAARRAIRSIRSWR